MPLYNFHCNKCMLDYERIVKSDINVIECNECQTEMSKVFSPCHAAFDLIGDGFYQQGMSIPSTNTKKPSE